VKLVHAALFVFFTASAGAWVVAANLGLFPYIGFYRPPVVQAESFLLLFPVFLEPALLAALDLDRVIEAPGVIKTLPLRFAAPGEGAVDVITAVGVTEPRVGFLEFRQLLHYLPVSFPDVIEQGVPCHDTEFRVLRLVDAERGKPVNCILQLSRTPVAGIGHDTFDGMGPWVPVQLIVFGNLPHGIRGVLGFVVA